MGKAVQPAFFPTFPKTQTQRLIQRKLDKLGYSYGGGGVSEDVKKYVCSVTDLKSKIKVHAALCYLLRTLG